MRSLLPLLPKPGRYAGLEEGAVRKDPASVRLRAALAFPDLYEVGMSYLGQKILYGQINAREDCLAERVFAPCRDAGRILRERQKLLGTLESGTPLADFHLLGFSVTHELCYTNVLYMLDLAGIPFRAADRGDDLTRWPTVIAGGGCALSAEPLAPFMDCMCLGDGEALLPDLLDLLIRAHGEAWSRSRFLLEASRVPGVYIPALFEARDGIMTPLAPAVPRPVRRIVNDLDAAPYPRAQVLPTGAVHNRLSLEIARGCTRGCRFCQAGMIYRPVRERSLPELTRLAEESLDATGFDELSFLSLSSGDFSGLRALFDASAERCAARQTALALPSLRVGSVDDSIMARIAGIRRTGATLAPEAGTQRLRDVINKGVTEEELITHVQKLMQHGWQRVKLYFMIGLPTERDEDIDAILDLCLKTRDAAGRGGPRLQVTCAISPFVPKPHTPFQWEAQIPLEEMRRRIGRLIALFKGRKGLTLRWHEAEMSVLEGVFSRGDRRLAPVLERAYAKGAIFGSWAEGFSFAPWAEALAECGLTVEEYTGPREPGAPLPWDHLENGVDPAFLLRERARALKEATSPDCRYGACLNCGVCETKAGPSRLAVPGVEPDVRNRLNFAQRDQSSEAPARDEQGRLVLPPRANAAPPDTAPELGVKAVRFRVHHRKDGAAVFLSQLELQSVLERALRRAGLPLAFSRGFHPLPLFSFGRALPVGVRSLDEWFCITLREPLTADRAAALLGPRLPEGLAITRVENLPVTGRVPQAQREFFFFEHLGDIVEQQRFLEHWRAFAQAQNFPWTYATKKGERTRDLRALAASVDFPEDGGVRCTLDWTTDYLSPLVLARAAGRENDPSRLRVTKLAQIFGT